jgi:hypothetical protein
LRSRRTAARIEQRAAHAAPARRRRHGQHAEPIGPHRRHADQRIVDPAAERQHLAADRRPEQLLLGDLGRAVERAARLEHASSLRQPRAVERFDAHTRA